ncbi:hypothetical protein [Glycomyces tenuis]|uniref:hypothetical protein n=1 Tax=Glycomyces tenuis TaxID=58116 RepID=UPI00047C234B|nr:hypothetical protein [Glycomyces tenuis]
MTTVEDAIAWRNRHGIALAEAFGLDPDKTAVDISVEPDSVTFKQVGAGHDIPAPAVVRGDGVSSVTTVEFPAVAWTPEQRRAVNAYLGQFPAREDQP